MSGESWAGLVVAFIIGMFVNRYLPAYFGEKGRNLATREDIGEITAKIESVKAEYSAELETTKAQLSAQLKTHGFRYEKEYVVLDELTALLVDVRDSTLALRPTADSYHPDETEHERKNRRLGTNFNALRALYQYAEKKRPFYTAEIHEAIVAVNTLARSEADQYQYESPFADQSKNYIKYWDAAQKNTAEMFRLSNEALEKIRTRVNQWEALL